MASLEDTLAKLKLDDVAANPSTTLAVHGSGSPTTSSFQKQKFIGMFRITKDKTYTSASVEIPKIIARHKWQNIRGIYLGTAYEDASLIPDYKEYHELKQEFFLKWIIENDYFRGVSQNKYKKPGFICFGGRITDPMMTPEVTRFGDWQMFAARVHDSIYLWDEKLNECVHNKQSYYGIYFEHLLTQENAMRCAPNEFDKVYVVNEIGFGSHQLLCLNEIDAADDDGNWVEIKVCNKCSPKGMSGKQLKYWAQSIVPGVKTLILGTRDNSGILSNIKKTTLNEVARKADWSTTRCYDFEDRFLTWIKSHFKENNPKIVKKISWSCGDSHIHCADVREKHIPKHMLPQWYLEAEQLKELFH